MDIKDAMVAARLQSGTTGIFYHPETMNAIFAEHGQEPEGYLIWCDCSRAIQAIQIYGNITDAYNYFANYDPARP